jgi:hypothetical protein
MKFRFVIRAMVSITSEISASSKSRETRCSPAVSSARAIGPPAASPRASRMIAAITRRSLTLASPSALPPRRRLVLILRG